MINLSPIIGRLFILSLCLVGVSSNSVWASGEIDTSVYTHKHHCLNLSCGYGSIFESEYIDMKEEFAFSYSLTFKSNLSFALLTGFIRYN